MALHRKWLFPAGLALLLALVAYTAIFHDAFAIRALGANDFFSRWAGARLYFTRGWNPYGEQTSLWIQNAVWGHPARPDEDPSLFAYPFYTVFLVAPYALTSDYSWAQAAWQVTLQAVVMATLALLLMYHRWRPTPLMLGALVLWMIVFYPSARSILLGQIGVVVFALTVLAVWLLFRNENSSAARDTWAGALLAISTVKPQMQFLIIPFILLWALRERRWWAIGSFAAVIAILVGLSFALLLTWLTEWIGQVSNYPAYTPPAVLFILTHEIIPLGPAADVVERVLDVLLIAYLLWEWWPIFIRRDDSHLDWTLGLTLVITHLVAPRTATTHFIVFVFALIALFRDWSKIPAVGGRIVLGVMFVLAVGMWWLFFATLVGRQESDLVHVPLPLIMLALLLFSRNWQAASQPEAAT